MRRAASVVLPHLAIERLRRPAPTHAPPERPPPSLPVDDDPGACSAPRGGGWRPGARWARDGDRAATAARADALPAHRLPPARELGRRSEAAAHPFRAMRPDEGGGTFGASPASTATAGTRPLVLAGTVGRRQVITAACRDAAAIGLAPGMSLTHARALVPDLDVLRADPAGDAAWIARLARHAVRKWTPTAAVVPDGLALDLTGTTHLFGGEERFCRRVVAVLARMGVTARIAIADTHGAAHAVARFGGKGIAVVPADATVQAIAGLPVAALRLGDDALAACRRFGLERIADLLPMPRAPLARRLGRAVVERLDQATGRAAEPIDGITIDDPPLARLQLLEPIGTPEAIGQMTDDLAAALTQVLRERGLGARSATLALLRVDGAEQTVTVGTARATRDARHLGRLLRLRLDTVDPGLGIEAGRLAATRWEPLGAIETAGELAGRPPRPDLAESVDRIVGRVGADAIFRATLVESDVPERAVARASPLAAVQGWPAWRRPARLLSRPEPLAGVVALLPDHPPRRFSWRGRTHVVAAGDGPERVHGEWWTREGETWAVRDYYRVEDMDGGRYWIFRRGDGVDPATGNLSWWMHGAFG